MSTFLSIRRIERRLRNQHVEQLDFRHGLNLLVGPPNSGKTTWLKMLDLTLADQDTPDEKLDAQLLAKYEAVIVTVEIGGSRHVIQRAWAGSFPKTKIRFDDEYLTSKEVQHRLLELLGIPLLHFPKGNPFSGQTWPELSFRMMLRHLYRQQRYWGDVADVQPDGERTACILQFVGAAEKIFTEEYGRLVEEKLELDALRARREQFGATLNEVAHELLGESASQVVVTAESLRLAEAQLADEVDGLQQKREGLIGEARDQVIASAADRERLNSLAEERARLIGAREDLVRELESGKQRESELCRYFASVSDERDRLQRATDASSLLADIKVTHCPACDQEVPSEGIDPSRCGLCGQQVAVAPTELSLSRLEFERERLEAEVAEAEDLLVVMQRKNRLTERSLRGLDERMEQLEAELRPARTAVSAFVQQSLTSIDRRLGEMAERSRQLVRIKAAWEVGLTLSHSIASKEEELLPLQEAVDSAMEQVDFAAAARRLTEGMNEYLTAMNRLRPNTWKHSGIDVRLGQAHSRFRVGDKEWLNALGGTDQLYFLMAYHYGLLRLSSMDNTHYPGIAIIDIPGEFAGESIRDLENFVVEPFADLVSSDSMAGTQVIICGSGFQGIPDAHRVELETVWVS